MLQLYYRYLPLLIILFFHCAPDEEGGSSSGVNTDTAKKKLAQILRHCGQDVPYDWEQVLELVRISRSPDFLVPCSGGKVRSVLHLAVASDDLSAVSGLLRLGSHPNPYLGKTDETILMAAIRKGNLDMVKLLLENGAEIDRLGRSETPYLHVAIQDRRPNLFKLLLQHEGDIYQTDEEQRNALHIATIYGDTESLSLMASRYSSGALDLERVDQHGYTPLHLAAWFNHYEVVIWLIKHGASTHSRTRRGLTPLDLALERGHGEITDLLKK